MSPSVQKDMEAFHGFFLDLIQKENFEVSIPMGDHSARYLSLYQESLRPFTSFMIPPYDVFMNAAQEQAIKIIRTKMN